MSIWGHVLCHGRGDWLLIIADHEVVWVSGIDLADTFLTELWKGDTFQSCCEDFLEDAACVLQGNMAA